MFGPVEREIAISIFAASTVVGLGVGPINGSFITHFMG
jgi:hypothetical protein